MWKKFFFSRNLDYLEILKKKNFLLRIFVYRDQIYRNLIKKKKLLFRKKNLVC